jgi:hypothetical protein
MRMDLARLSDNTYFSFSAGGASALPPLHPGNAKNNMAEEAIMQWTAYCLKVWFI